MRLYFVTSNPNKLREAEHITGIKFAHKYLDIDEVQEVDGRKVVEKKAMTAHRLAKAPVIVEDTCFCINALNGFPGALAKWMWASIGAKGICGLMDNYKDRSAYAITYVAFYDGHEMRVFSGRIQGTVSKNPGGKNGFGWDHIFIPEGHSMLFAEMSMEEKSRISMRMKAFLKLRRFLITKEYIKVLHHTK